MVCEAFGDAVVDSSYKGAIKAAAEKEFKFRVLRVDEIRDPRQNPAKCEQYRCSRYDPLGLKSISVKDTTKDTVKFVLRVFSIT